MAELVRVVEGFGGSVPQGVQGDGFMAVFGVPLAHEDDPERAVRAALATVRRIGELNAARRGTHLPEIHAGINSGEVMVAPLGSEPSGFAVVGDAVNVAARLSSLASGGQVLTGERTMELTAHAIRYGPPRVRRVKGKTTPLTVYEALSPMTAAPGGHVSPSRAVPFVGRDDALARLRRELDSTKAEGRSRVLLVRGDPGVGKTRLAAEFVDRTTGTTVLAGRCFPYGQWLPFVAIADAVRDFGGIPPQPGRRPNIAIRRLAEELAGTRGAAALARQLRFLLGIESPTGSAGAPATGPHLRLAARTVLETIARRGPVVAVIDDLQWGDPALADLLADAHRAPWAGPILFLGLGRPGEGPPGLRGLPTFPLAGLRDEDLRRMVDLTLSPAVPEPVSRVLVARAGGNALFLEESARMLAETGALVPSGDGWALGDAEGLGRVPATLRSLIAARLDALGAEEKRALQDASVAGQSTWSALMERLWGGTAIGPLLRALEARDLLHRRPNTAVPGAVEYEFKHALIRDVAYASVPRADRAARHLQIADWLREATGDAEQFVDRLAHHYEQAWLLSRSRTGAAPPSDTARQAAEHLNRWGQRAFLYEPRLAESVFRRGLAVASSAADTLSPTLSAELRIGRAECLVELARNEEAMAEAGTALASGSLRRRPELRGRALLAVGRARSHLGDVDTARSLLEEALKLFGRASEARGQAWTVLSLSETVRLQDYRRQVDLLREALDLFVQAGDRWGEEMVAQDLAYLLTPDGGPEFRRAYDEARRLAEAEGDLRSRAAVLRTWSYFCYYRGEFDEAVRAAREFRPMAVEVGDRWVEVDALLIEAMVAAAAEPPDTGERLSERIVTLAGEVKGRRLRALGLLVGARPALRDGRAGVARRRLETARRLLRELEATEEMVEADLTAAALANDQGAWHRVARPATQVQEHARRQGMHLYEVWGPLLRGRALMGAGRLDRARAELEEAAAIARAADAPGPLALADAAATQVRLLGGAGRGKGRTSPTPGKLRWPDLEAIRAENRGLRVQDRDPAAAAEAFADAVELWEGLGFTAWLARSLMFRASALGRIRRHAAARRATERAGVVLDRIGAPPQAARWIGASSKLAGSRNRP
jgi:tetratricopeptide (TPR) repeat protein